MKRRDFLRIAAASPLIALALPEQRHWYPWPYDSEWLKSPSLGDPDDPFAEVSDSYGDSQLNPTLTNAELRSIIREEFMGEDYDDWWFDTIRNYREDVEAARNFWGIDTGPGWEHRCLPLQNDIVTDELQSEFSSVFSDVHSNGWCDGKRSYRYGRLVRRVRSEYTGKPYYRFLISELARVNGGPS